MSAIARKGESFCFKMPTRERGWWYVWETELRFPPKSRLCVMDDSVQWAGWANVEVWGCGDGHPHTPCPHPSRARGRGQSPRESKDFENEMIQHMLDVFTLKRKFAFEQAVNFDINFDCQALSLKIIQTMNIRRY